MDSYLEAVEALVRAAREMLFAIDHARAAVAPSWEPEDCRRIEECGAVLDDALTPLEEAERIAADVEWDGEKIVRRDAVAELTSEAEKLGMYKPPTGAMPPPGACPVCGRPAGHHALWCERY